MNTLHGFTRTTMTAVGLSATALLLASCGSEQGTSEQGWVEVDSAVESGASPMLFLGDSVAAQQATAVRQAVAESGAYFIDGTSTGGGNVVGPNAEASWDDMAERLEQAADGVVVYQLTGYDWGTPEEQEGAYATLAEKASDVGAELLLVSMPPIEADDFYADHMAELAAAEESARAVAADVGHVEFLDASAVWGEEYSRDHQGVVDRSEDGIHVCPQGAARFTAWLMEELSAQYPEFDPVDVDAWANTGWAEDDAFFGCD